MTRTKKALVTVAFAMAAAAGVSSPAFADFHATTVPVTTDDFHATGISE